jgi:mannose-6-phosphate isomerase-like protein (cupin superfamily)
MAKLVSSPSRIKAAGTLEKIIEEYIGAVNTNSENVSIALMTSPSGWVEPGQKPDFDEYSIVLSGTLRAESESSIIEAGPGQAIITRKGEWVRYSTPGNEGAQYIAVCIPAFTPGSVNRDE